MFCNVFLCVYYLNCDFFFLPEGSQVEELQMQTAERTKISTYGKQAFIDRDTFAKQSGRALVIVEFSVA